VIKRERAPQNFAQDTVHEHGGRTEPKRGRGQWHSGGPNIRDEEEEHPSLRGRGSHEEQDRTSQVQVYIHDLLGNGELQTAHTAVNEIPNEMWVSHGGGQSIVCMSPLARVVIKDGMRLYRSAPEDGEMTKIVRQAANKSPGTGRPPRFVCVQHIHRTSTKRTMQWGASREQGTIIVVLQGILRIQTEQFCEDDRQLTWEGSATQGQMAWIDPETPSNVQISTEPTTEEALFIVARSMFKSTSEAKECPSLKEEVQCTSADPCPFSHDRKTRQRRQVARPSVPRLQAGMRAQPRSWEAGGGVTGAQRQVHGNEAQRDLADAAAESGTDNDEDARGRGLAMRTGNHHEAGEMHGAVGGAEDARMHSGEPDAKHGQGQMPSLMGRERERQDQLDILSAVAGTVRQAVTEGDLVDEKEGDEGDAEPTSERPKAPGDPPPPPPEMPGPPAPESQQSEEVPGRRDAPRSPRGRNTKEAGGGWAVQTCRSLSATVLSIWNALGGPSHDPLERQGGPMRARHERKASSSMAMKNEKERLGMGKRVQKGPLPPPPPPPRVPAPPQSGLGDTNGDVRRKRKRGVHNP
jgi:hypothetical protein